MQQRSTSPPPQAPQPVPVPLPTLIRVSIHHKHDLPERIGAIPSENRLTAPMPWRGIVFLTNTRRDSLVGVCTFHQKSTWVAQLTSGLHVVQVWACKSRIMGGRSPRTSPCGPSPELSYKLSPVLQMNARPVPSAAEETSASSSKHTPALYPVPQAKPRPIEKSWSVYTPQPATGVPRS